MQLRSFYESPGFVFIGRNDLGEAVGCIAMRQLDGAVGELRRLFVQPAGRATGLGRRLAIAVVQQARSQGLARLVLNTLPTMTAAIALYESMGFVTSAAYEADPTEGVLFFELML